MLSRMMRLLSLQMRLLTELGLINFGVARRLPLGQDLECVIVGAGLAGLGAALHLQGMVIVVCMGCEWWGMYVAAMGVRTVVLEAESCAGGRCKLRSLGQDCVVDIGGAVVTGMLQNPLVQLATQLGLKLKTLHHQNCPLFDGTSPLAGDVDVRAEELSNSLMEVLERCLESRFPDDLLTAAPGCSRVHLTAPASRM